MDRAFADQLRKLATNHRDFENLYVQTKKLAYLAENQAAE
jgi:hypothetical protein